MLLNEQITQLRKQKKLSQEELAAALQVSRQAVSKWENGVSNPDTENLIRLAEIFEVDVNVLIGSPENQKSTQEEKVPEGKIPDQRRLVRWLSVLLAVAVCAAVLFGTLWITERVENKQMQAIAESESRWDSVKLYEYTVKGQVEVPITEEAQNLLANLVWNHRYTPKTENDTTIVYGTYYIILALEKDGVTYTWSFGSRTTYFDICLADGHSLRYEYEPDQQVFDYLGTFIKYE